MNDYYNNGSETYGQPVLSIQEYTARTFLWMFVGLLITFGVGIAGMMSGMVYLVLVRMPWLMLALLVATLALSITMAARIERMSVGAAQGLFLTFSALMGVTMSVTLSGYDLGAVIIVFAAAALYFAVMALFGHFTGIDLSRMGPILLSGLTFLVILGILGLFIPFLSLSNNFFCYVGIVLFLGYTAYDTQQIRNYYSYYCGYPDMLEKAAVFSALQLYLDFLNLFIRLLQLFGRRRRN